MPPLQHPSPTASSAGIPVSEIPTSSSSERPIHDPSLLTCPTCTYLNHRSMRYCEICDSVLPSRDTQMSTPTSVPSRSSATTPAPIDASLPTTANLRISFRKGGDKAFYVALKNALKGKAWESVRPLIWCCSQNAF
jgi:ESCRT-II complex subunit VPS36